MIGSGSSVFWDWEDGVLTWCEECDAAVQLRSCPNCGLDLCKDCADDHDCSYDGSEEEW